MNQSTPEIAITWNPSHPRSQSWFNVPLNTVCKVELVIQARIGTDFLVVIKKPLSPWLSLSRRTGIVPFRTIVTVDTAGLGYREGHKEELEFQVSGITIYKEPIYLTTQVYDPNEQQGLQQSFAPLDAGRPKRNLFISIFTAISTLYHIGFSIVFMLLVLFVVTIVLVIIGAG